MLRARFFAVVGALALATTIGSPVSAVAPLIKGGVPSALPSAPVILPTAAFGTCGPVNSGPGEIDGVIYDPQITTHASPPPSQQNQLVWYKSTAIAFPISADPRTFIDQTGREITTANGQYFYYIANAITAARNLAIANAATQQPTSGPTLSPEAVSSASAAAMSAMEQYGNAQASAAGAYANVGSQAVSAQLSLSPRSKKYGEFACRGLAILKSIPYEMIVTELFNDSVTGATVTRYYLGYGVALPSVVGLPTTYTILNCVGSIPYSLTNPADNCPKT